ncbi:MAG: hypothetical protein KME13_01760 [Myxacorys californica WJT36-NPBG1]|jgi:hypothetical protein|nr:hypothetical protein [Myxacorys californica WJT36-NPBG1]
MPTSITRLDRLPLDRLPIELLRPTATDTSGAPEPDNSEIRKIANDVLQAVQYSFASVAANPNQAVRADTLEETFQQTFKRMDAAKLERVQTKATQLVSAAPELRTTLFGRYGQLESKEFVSIGFDRAHEGLAPLAIDQKLLGIRTSHLSIPQGVGRMTPEGLLIPAANLPQGFEDFEDAIDMSTQRAAESHVYNAEKLQEIWGPVYSTDPFAGAGADEFEEQAVTDKLGFYVTRVKCVDETNPEFWGSDEIAIAGVSVDEDGDSKKISEHYVGGGFDDGDEKNYSPNWNYHWFSMQEGNYWPKAYKVALMLAEKDNGGLSTALNTIWEKIGEKVKEAIAKAVTGALSGYVGPAIAAAIGQAVAWIVDKLVGWIITAFQDDIFPVFTASCTVPSFNARWNYPNGTWGSPTSDVRTAHFYGHGGHYIVNYYWKLYA